MDWLSSLSSSVERCWMVQRKTQPDRSVESAASIARRLVMTSSLSAQIAEVERELSMRRRVYPHQVMARRMKKEAADLHISRMEDVLTTLKSLENGHDNES